MPGGGDACKLRTTALWPPSSIKFFVADEISPWGVGGDVVPEGLWVCAMLNPSIGSPTSTPLQAWVSTFRPCTSSVISVGIEMLFEFSGIMFSRVTERVSLVVEIGWANAPLGLVRERGCQVR